MEECYLVKVTLLHGCFSRFLNCKNGTKSCKASQIWDIRGKASVGMATVTWQLAALSFKAISKYLDSVFVVSSSG